MDGQDDVPGRDQVDLPTDQARVILVTRLECLQRQAEAILGSRHVGAADLGREAAQFGRGQAQPVRDGTERLIVVAPIDVDPEQLAVAELLDVDVGLVDLAVVPVGVE